MLNLFKRKNKQEDERELQVYDIIATHLKDEDDISPQATLYLITYMTPHTSRKDGIIGFGDTYLTRAIRLGTIDYFQKHSPFVEELIKDRIIGADPITRRINPGCYIILGSIDDIVGERKIDVHVQTQTKEDKELLDLVLNTKFEWEEEEMDAIDIATIVYDKNNAKDFIDMYRAYPNTVVAQTFGIETEDVPKIVKKIIKLYKVKKK